MAETLHRSLYSVAEFSLIFPGIMLRVPWFLKHLSQATGFHMFALILQVFGIVKHLRLEVEPITAGAKVALV